jgi:hypothetical protein
MGWAGRGSNPGGAEVFRTRPDQPWGQPSLSFSVVKRPWRGVNHLPISIAEVKERIELDF